MTAIGDLLTEYKDPAAGRDFEVLTLTEKRGFVRQADRFNKRLATEDTSKYKVIRRGDIAFNPYLVWAGAVAQNTIVDAGVISPLYPTFKVRRGFDPRYVGLLLLAPEVVKRYDGIAFGSVPRRRRTSVADFLNLEVPSPPPIEEQRRIASILDGVRRLHSQASERMGLFAEQSAALVAQATRKASATTSLGSIIESGPSNGLYKPGSAYGTGTRIVRIDSFDGGKIDQAGLKRLSVTPAEQVRFGLDPTDILINRVNAMSHVGKAALVGPLDEPAVYESNMMRIRVGDEWLPEFIAAWLSSQDARRQIRSRAKQAINQASINGRDVKALRVPALSSREQHDLVGHLNRVTALAAQQSRMSEAIDVLWASLEARAFSGRL